MALNVIIFSGLILMSMCSPTALYHAGNQTISPLAASNSLTIKTTATGSYLLYAPMASTYVKLYGLDSTTGLYILLQTLSISSVNSLAISDDASKVFILTNPSIQYYSYVTATNTITLKDTFSVPAGTNFYGIDVSGDGTNLIYTYKPTATSIICAVAQFDGSTYNVVHNLSIANPAGGNPYYIRITDNYYRIFVSAGSGNIMNVFYYDGSAYQQNNTLFDTSALSSAYQSFEVTSDGEILVVSMADSALIYKNTTNGYILQQTWLKSDFYADYASAVNFNAAISDDGQYLLLGLNYGVAYLYFRQATHTVYDQIRVLNFSSANSQMYGMRISSNGTYLFINPSLQGSLQIFYPCVSHCDVCLNTINCVSCQSGFTLSATFLCQCSGTNMSLSSDFSQCINCSIQNCYLCLQAGVCFVCQQGFTLTANNLCVCLPPLTYTAPLCISCSIQYCLSCLQSNQCSACPFGFDMPSSSNNYTCQCTAPSSINPISSFCLNCNVSYCVRCGINNTCQECIFGFTNTSTSCICNASNLMTVNSLSNACLLCNVSNCLRCELDNVCSLCKTNFTLTVGFTCSCTAPSTLSLNSQLCNPCSIQYCLRCDTANVCASCPSGFNVSGGSCVCGNGNNSFTINSSGMCVGCSVPYCNRCDANAVCAFCSSGFTLVNGTCLCQNGSSIDTLNATCVLCSIPYCIRCDHPNFCAACNSNFTASAVSGLCSCAPPSTISSSLACIPCSPAFCLRCDVPNVCSLCPYEYKVENGQCTVITAGIGAAVGGLSKQMIVGMVALIGVGLLTIIALIILAMACLKKNKQTKQLQQSSVIDEQKEKPAQPQQKSIKNKSNTNLNDIEEDKDKDRQIRRGRRKKIMSLKQEGFQSMEMDLNMIMDDSTVPIRQETNYRSSSKMRKFPISPKIVEIHDSMFVQTEAALDANL